MVSGHGRSGAEILFVGDSASNEDILNGVAISGTGEKTLRAIFHSAGGDFSQTYRTLLYKERLNYNGKSKKKLKEAIEEVEESIRQASGRSATDILADEIVSIGPNIVVPLGEFSFNSLTGIRSINKYRGSILPLRADIQNRITDRAVKVIPTFGPRMLEENYSARTYTSIDLQKAVKYRSTTQKIDPEGRLWIAKTASSLQNFLSRVKWEDNYLVFDIETVYGIPVCISLCFDTDEAVCVPLLNDDSIDKGELLLFWQMISKVLRNKIGKVNQNIKYDWSILERFRFSIRNIVGDTVLRSGLIYPELPKNLGFLTSVYTEMPYHKDEGTDADSRDRSKLYLYCAKDSLATRRIYEAQKSELAEFGLVDLEEKLMKLFFIYKKMDWNGILIDDSARQFLRLKYESLLEMNTSTLKSIVSPDFNPRSSQQCGKLIYEELRYPVRKKDDNYKTDEDTLEELLILSECKFKEGPEVLRLIIVCRKLAKVLEYINTVTHPDNRLRGSFNLVGTENARTGCGKSIDRLLIFEEDSKKKTEFALKDIGRSLQTISKHGFRVGTELFGTDLRRMFVPTPGYVFVEADLSQAEARVDAVLCEDYEL